MKRLNSSPEANKCTFATYRLFSKDCIFPEILTLLAMLLVQEFTKVMIKVGIIHLIMIILIFERVKGISGNLCKKAAICWYLTGLRIFIEEYDDLVP